MLDGGRFQFGSDKTCGPQAPGSGTFLTSEIADPPSTLTGLKGGVAAEELEYRPASMPIPLA